jgi:hypothetical protein
MTRLIYLLVTFFFFSFHSLAFAEYIKVSNSGKALPASALLGSGEDDWACTYDSATKLMWEVKTTDGGLRDRDWWYMISPDVGGNGTTNSDCETQGRCDTQQFTQDVNA